MIAEISANHGGSIEKAKKSIKAAKEAGANAVKIQSYTPDTMTINSDRSDFQISKGLWQGRSLHDLYAEAHTPYEWHEELFNFAKKEKSKFIISVLMGTNIGILLQQIVFQTLPLGIGWTLLSTSPIISLFFTKKEEGILTKEIIISTFTLFIGICLILL